MRVLGFEGTAHTCGVGIVASDPDEPERCHVLANEVSMLRPASGGIHPREAADHHVDAVGPLLARALDAAGLDVRDLDGIAFSQGPGLGPCLRIVASAARALAVRHDLPLMGVNHCVAHLEVGRATTGATDPVMLYASGANTQVIAESRGRYRVFGETLDIGIGNALDKFARDEGLPFPGGPEVERLAAEGARMLAETGGALPELPYSTRGMDVAFSGTVTAARALRGRGVTLPVVAHALQEWGFAMLVEATERALAYTGKDEVLLGGGVARNARLQEMVGRMAEDRGASSFCPEPRLLSDNGAMIAWNGLVQLRTGGATAVAASAVDQRYRTDDVDLLWRPARNGTTTRGPDDSALETGGRQGAEAWVQATDMFGGLVVVKERVPKGYRHPAIEAWLRATRLRHEARLLHEAAMAGLPVPGLLDADPDSGRLWMEHVPGPTLARWLDDRPSAPAPLLEQVGALIARLHAAGIVHGDLTGANVLVRDGAPVLIDLGLAARSDDPEQHAVDLHVLEESLVATQADHAALWDAVRRGYAAAGAADAVEARLAQIALRGRYRSSQT